MLCILFFLFSGTSLVAQSGFKSNQVTSTVLSGRLKCMDEVSNFARLPISVKGEVRDAVWSLGDYSAGEYVDFKTNADSIIVKYKVKGALNMPHMPTTGVSGVDLYFNHDKSGDWSWAYGAYQFKDTIQYSFEHIGQHTDGFYRLYLPMYNMVEFMEIAVPASKTFEFVTSKTKPIVIYGTSIAQGACASRPGMGWTNILGRDFKNEVINLGFSGNGRLEQPILDLMVAEDAAVYILDCLPNLGLLPSRTEAQLDSLIQASVQFIRSKCPNTPIVLTEHSSAFTPGFLNKAKMEEYALSTRVGEKSYAKLQKAGVKNVYYLPSSAIGLDVNSTVDYAHPNDVGMMKIAKAYAKLLNKIWK